MPFFPLTLFIDIQQEDRRLRREIAKVKREQVYDPTKKKKSPKAKNRLSNAGRSLSRRDSSSNDDVPESSFFVTQ